jgi:nitrous oxide reductase accessory protein NosL
MKQLFQCHRTDEFGFKGLRLVSGALLLCAILIGGACEKAPVKPVDITANDVCFYCKSPITEVAFAAEFVTRSGFVRKFDDIGCLIADAKKVGKSNIQAFYAMDVFSKKWFPAEQVQFVRSDKLRTPRKGGIVAVQDATKAQQLAARYQAEVVKLDDIVK